MSEKNNNSRQTENENLRSKTTDEKLHTADPQENMQGPVSSPMHKTGEAFETSETKKEADRIKEKNL